MVVSFSHCGHLLASKLGSSLLHSLLLVLYDPSLLMLACLSPVAAKYDTLSAPLYNNGTTSPVLSLALRKFTDIALWLAADVVYSLILYDTDTDEEVWAEYIAHHAVIYDIQWSKNDRYLLTCAGDGSCKVWDLLYFCPLLDAIERAKALAQAQTLSSTVADNTASNAQPTPREGEGQQSSSEAAGLEAFAGISKSEVLISHPPRIIQILSLGSALYSYCGLFQEFNVSTLLSTMQLINTFQGSTVSGLLGVPTLQEQFHAIERGTVPRIIIGCADGRLRVFEDNRFLGFISVPSDSPGEENTEDFSPHDAQINALVIDERSK